MISRIVAIYTIGFYGKIYNRGEKIMGKTFQFIHAADLHIGSFLNINGKPQEEIQELCKSAVYDGFKTICYKAILYNVDFILICGDIYDSYLRSVRGNRFFITECEKLNTKDIDVYVIYGNHDAINDGEELFTMPPNVHILSSNKVDIFEIYKEGQVIAKIIGKSYKRRNEQEKIYEDYVIDNDVFNIAMLHTALEKDNKNYVPCTQEALSIVPNIDYWALGHIHKHNVLNYAKPIIAFPGIPQGRDMGEQGRGGVFLVTACMKDIVNIEFLPVATVIYKKVELIICDADMVGNYSDLLCVILAKVYGLTYDIHDYSNKTVQYSDDLEDKFKGYIIQLIIKGRTSLHQMVTHMTEDDYEQFLENINEELSSSKYFLWVDSIIFRTTQLKQDIESLKMQNSIFKDLEEVICLYTNDPECREELVKNWGSIWKKQIYSENIDEDKFDFDEEITLDIILQAKELLIEKLAEVLEII